MNRNHLPLWAQIILDERIPSSSALLAVNKRSQTKQDHAAKTQSRSGSLPGSSNKDCLVLMAHGSRDARWRGTFECLYASVQSRFTGNVRLAYMEFVGPTLMDVARECFEQGVRSLRVLPLFMAGGAHVATDIPEQMDQVRVEFPSMTIEAMSPIGEDPRMFAVIQEIIGENIHPDSPGKFTAA